MGNKKDILAKVEAQDFGKGTDSVSVEKIDNKKWWRIRRPATSCLPAASGKVG